MGRIRTIKPEFPMSETIGRLSREARLLFIQLWTFVDDSGKARAASRVLASYLYPFDEDAPALIDKWLSELERHNCIIRYRVDDTSYLQVTNWLKHQKIDRPSPSRLPECPKDSTSPREPSRALDAGPSTLDRGPSTLDHRTVDVRAPDPWLDICVRAVKHYEREGGKYIEPRGFTTKCKEAGYKPEVVLAILQSGWAAKPDKSLEYWWPKIVQDHGEITLAQSKPPAHTEPTYKDYYKPPPDRVVSEEEKAKRAELQKKWDQEKRHAAAS